MEKRRRNISWQGLFEKGGSLLFAEIKELFYRHARVFKNTFKRPTVNFFMIRNYQRNLLGRMKKLDVASFLANVSLTGAQKNSDDFIPGQKRRFYTAKLKTLWLGVEWISLGLGSKYKRIASFILRIVSFSVRPWLWQPGNEGTLAVIYPSSPFSKTILSFISLTSRIKYTLVDPESQIDSIAGDRFPIKAFGNDDGDCFVAAACCERSEAGSSQ